MNMQAQAPRGVVDMILISKNVEHGVNAEQVFDSLSVAVGILNENSILVYCNPAFAEFCGISRVDLRGRSFIEIFRTLYVIELYLEEIGTFLGTMKDTKELSFEIPNGSGKNIPIRLIIDPLLHNNKPGWKICTLLRDNSVSSEDRVCAPILLPEQEMRSVSYRRAIESFKSLLRTRWWSAQLLCSVIVKHMAELFNTPVAGICFLANEKVDFGARYQDGDIIKEETVHLTEHVAHLICRDQRLSIHYGDVHTRFQHLSGKSAEKLHALMGMPLYSTDGKITGVIYVADCEGCFFDKTDMDLLEILVWYVSVAFERFVAENMSRNDEYETNLLYSVFSGLVHEVRNPLTGITLLTEAIKNDLSESPEYTHYFSLINEQAHRLSALMQQLLLLSQPVQVKKCTLDTLVELCNTAITVCKNFRTDSGNTVRLLEPESCQAALFLGDRDRLTYAVEQLLLNALQHSENRSEIIVDVGEIERSVYIKVIDQGMGIPAEYKHRIFEPFFTTRKKQNGLGLSIVKRIIDAHNGNITIRNNKFSQGCTAELRIPLVKAY